MPRIYTRRTLAERFWEKVDKHGPIPASCPERGPCWMWTASLKSTGYGQIADRGTMRIASRVAWELVNGPIPEGMDICHHCDNPPCVNAERHHFLGDRVSNMADAVEKHRVASGDRHGLSLHPERRRRGPDHWTRSKPERVAHGDGSPARLHPESVPRGAAHANAKLTDAIVREMRQRFADSAATISEMASEYGIVLSAVSKVVHLKSWKHVL